VSVALEIGLEPPDFELRNQHGESVSLSSYRGSRRVVLVFYPYAFSRVCSSELHALRDQLPEFANERTQLLAVSCDHMFSLRAFADRDSLGFPLLSDFWPHGGVSQLYGVFDHQRGCANRGTFILDTSGVLRWSVHHEMSDARSIEDYKTVLAGL
jgi:mycoredoxin-dependent peroxiredoxin